VRWVLALLVLVGCDFVDVVEGIGVAAPRVLSSSPSGNPSLATDGVIDFRVEAEDEDSLNLTWTFFADDIAEATGDTSTGEVLATWQLAWSEELSGTDVNVTFEITDTLATTDLAWVVDIE
jgi:hypothetical protein